MNIENPEFDAVNAFYDLISTHSLEELLLLENNLVSEVRTLDGNMQTLVYENYNKFISATDTIRDMKSNVERMEEQMNKLSQNMSRIQELSKSVEDSTSTRQSEIQRLVQINDELQKIKYIYELPASLRAAIDANKNKQQLDFSQAASSFSSSFSFLTEHKADVRLT